jgi:small-conductance mechanosensitive channel
MAVKVIRDRGVTSGLPDVPGSGFQGKITMKRDKLIEGVVLFLCGGVTVVLSLQMSIGTFRMAGSGLFPLCLGIILMLLALLYLGDLLLQKGAKGLPGEAVGAASGSAGQMLLFFCASALAVLCLNVLGYPLTAFFLMLMLLRILGVRRPALLITMPLLTAVASYLLFVRFLKIPLPKGLIGL